MISKKIRLVNQKVDNSDFMENDLSNAPDGFFEEIFVADVLEVSQNENVIEDICKKIKIKGTVKFTGIDAQEICRQVYYGTLPLEQVSQNYFSKITRANSVVSIQNKCKQLGFDIVFAGVESSKYFVEAKRK